MYKLRTMGGPRGVVVNRFYLPKLRSSSRLTESLPKELVFSSADEQRHGLKAARAYRVLGLLGQEPRRRALGLHHGRPEAHRVRAEALECDGANVNLINELIIISRRQLASLASVTFADRYGSTFFNKRIMFFEDHRRRFECYANRVREGSLQSCHPFSHG